MLGIDEGGGLCDHDGCEEEKDIGSLLGVWKPTTRLMW